MKVRLQNSFYLDGILYQLDGKKSQVFDIPDVWVNKHLDKNDPFRLPKAAEIVEDDASDEAEPPTTAEQIDKLTANIAQATKMLEGLQAQKNEEDQAAEEAAKAAEEAAAKEAEEAAKTGAKKGGGKKAAPAGENKDENQNGEAGKVDL